MENPYEGYHFQSYTPQSEQEPESSGYAGNTPLATVSLVMGILSILSVCCFPPALFIFSGLGILFSCLSKGEHTRPGTAKAGMAICTSCLVILTSAVIIVCSLFLSTDRGRSFLHDYMDLITSGELDEENLYDFMEKYFPDYYNYSGDSLLIPHLHITLTAVAVTVIPPSTGMIPPAFTSSLILIMTGTSYKTWSSFFYARPIPNTAFITFLITHCTKITAAAP